MGDIKSFLKVCKRYGYPNPKLQTLANLVGYDLDNFLLDLETEIGNKGVLDFCEKAIVKLTGKKCLRVDVSGPKNNEYVYIHIYPIFYDKEESENDIISNSAWGESKLLAKNDEGIEEYRTIEEIIDDSDMGSWSEVDDFIEDMKGRANRIVFENCGFGIWWQ